MQQANSRGPVMVLALAVLAALGNLAALLSTREGFREAFGSLMQTGALAPLQVLSVDVLRSDPGSIGFLLGAPLVLAILAVAILRGAAPATAAPAADEPSRVEERAPVSALRLLALLQQEARLIDFISEDLSGYEDARVGAAAREIHAGCRKALTDRVRLQRVLNDEEGSQVVVEAGFDPGAIRLTGNVSGAPPFHGTLQHAGWRAVECRLPQTAADMDPALIAPAEVEIP